MAHSSATYDSYRPNRPTNRLDMNLRRGDSWTPDSHPASHDQTNSFTAWHHTPSIVQSIEPHDGGHPEVPEVYDREIDSLVGRTIRAYRLVINYQRDCPTGLRWMPEHIEMIHEAGKSLQTDREALDSLRVGLARGEDAVLIGRVRAAAHTLRDCCWEVQELIRVHEQVPVFHGKAERVEEHGDFVSPQFRDPFVETGSREGIRRVAGRARLETPMEQRDPSLPTQPGRSDGSGRPGEGGRYFASDTWRPT
ncbi:hypothetical protein P171DRAFT_427571 [Karstenula rhodostoma CBS 690.94]|uniref:Uncharacterized protein n=1 Tax=Karstenula rhodostoma CBS 690.94 TaxID=1392251 RepID=A0A9P4PSG7_9PLEO|nr:hypothetical protein P171DRAFT_427571 [Karstenula rhodostoma CBS 690.94]